MVLASNWRNWPYSCITPSNPNPLTDAGITPHARMALSHLYYGRLPTRHHWPATVLHRPTTDHHVECRLVFYPSVAAAALPAQRSAGPAQGYVLSMSCEHPLLHSRRAERLRSGAVLLGRRRAVLCTGPVRTYSALRTQAAGIQCGK